MMPCRQKFTTILGGWATKIFLGGKQICMHAHTHTHTHTHLSIKRKVDVMFRDGNLTFAGIPAF